MNEQQRYPNPSQSYPYHYHPQASPAYYPTYQTRQTPQQQQQQTVPPEGILPMEQSYIENILRLNRGKEVTIYMTFDNDKKNFKGVIEEAGRDHIIISDPETGERYLLLMVYLDYVMFNEKVNYEYPFNGGGAGLLSDYPTR